MGLLTLLPLIFAFWITMKIANAAAYKGSSLSRFIGVSLALVIGGICIFAGYCFAIEGLTEWKMGGYQTTTYPVIGWISIIGGGIIALLGTWTALVGTREEIELREYEQEHKWAKEEAEKILEQGKIDDYEKLDMLLKILSNMHEFYLSISLEDLKKKQVKRQKKG